MFRRFAKKNLVGVDVGSSSVKAVELRGKPGAVTLESLGLESLRPDSMVEGQIMELNEVSGVIEGIFARNNIKGDKVVAGVSGSSVIVKNIVLPSMTDDELAESIDWHAEEHIPFDIADVTLDYQILERQPDSLHILMAACKREFVSNLKQVIQLAGREPAIIDVDAFALQNCYELNYEISVNDIVALLNIGASKMNINILQGARSVFTRDVSVGGNQYTAALQKELSLTFEQAEAIKCGGQAPEHFREQSREFLMQGVSEILALEVKKTFDFFRATAADESQSVQKILMCGGGSKLVGLHEFLAGRFELPVEEFDPFRRVKFDHRRFDPEYVKSVQAHMAVAVGLALRGVSQ